jgi:SNF2 family DNA or RNA helicase
LHIRTKIHLFSIVQDASKLGSIKWHTLIVDEAHRLKSNTSKVATVMKNFSSRHTMFLTGTPIQNKLDELWSLLSLIDKSKFSDRDLFMDMFGDMKSTEQVRRRGEEREECYGMG